MRYPSSGPKLPYLTRIKNEWFALRNSKLGGNKKFVIGTVGMIVGVFGLVAVMPMVI
jgi:hypothetical protein